MTSCRTRRSRSSSIAPVRPWRSLFFLHSSTTIWSSRMLCTTQHYSHIFWASLTPHPFFRGYKRSLYSIMCFVVGLDIQNTRHLFCCSSLTFTNRISAALQCSSWFFSRPINRLNIYYQKLILPHVQNRGQSSKEDGPFYTRVLNGNY